MVALGGTGYAAFRLPAGSVGTPQLRNGAVTAQKVRAHSLLASDFRPGQLRGAIQGLSGSRGSTGLQGPAGPPGPAGTARAYGLVSPTGALSQSKNVGGVSHPSTGIYCIAAAGISPATTVLAASPDEDAGNSRAIAHVNSAAPDCPAGSFEVEMRHLELSTTTPPTIVAHHGDNGFSFIIP